MALLFDPAPNFDLPLTKGSDLDIDFQSVDPDDTPVVASDVPVMTIPMAANSHAVYDYGSLGLRFGTGIAWACTGAIGDTDATNAVVGGKVFLSYI